MGGKRVRHATGFMVSDCEVLTVKHAAGRVPTALGRRLYFAQGQRSGRRSSGTVIAEGDLDLVANWFSGDRSGDWLLLRLDQCLGRDIGYVSLSSRPFYLSGHWAPQKPYLQSAGFPVGRRWRDGITRDPRCRIRAFHNVQQFNDCAAHPGNSGSPLFVIQGSGSTAKVTVFAMQSTSTITGRVEPWRLDRSSVAVAIDHIAPQLAPFLTKADSSRTAMTQMDQRAEPGRLMSAMARKQTFERSSTKHTMD
jgi:hypothetical protein